MITREMLDTRRDTQVLIASTIVIYLPEGEIDSMPFLSENAATIYGRLFYGTSVKWHLSTEC